MAVLGLLALVAVTLPGVAQITGLKTLSGHVPSAVSHLTAKGDLAATNILTLAIGLPLHNTGDLSNLLQQVYDPTSPNYHHYLTTAEFTARFGPTAEDYQAVADFARASGFEIIGTHANRMILDVRAKVPDAENAFHLKMKQYRHPSEPRDFYTADTDPSISSNLPISHISGLDNFASARPLLNRRPNAAAPALGTAPGGAYAGQDFRNAYVPGTGLTGAGQNVALFQVDAFLCQRHCRLCRPDRFGQSTRSGYCAGGRRNAGADAFW